VTFTVKYQYLLIVVVVFSAAPMAPPARAPPSDVDTFIAIPEEFNVRESNIESEDTANWQKIIDEMSLVGLVKELAGHCALKEHNEGKVHLLLSPDKEHLLNQTQKERLANALEMRFGKGTQLKISIEEPEAETPEKTTSAKLSEYYGVSQMNDAVVFVTLYPRAENVQIAGDFNNWQPEQHIMEKVGDSGVWQTQMKLDPGRYRYRLVVDGQWQQDPYNESTEMNPFGGFNSIVEIT